MARSEIRVAAAPEDVFAVLAEPDSYGHWVVGSREIRDADAAWPAVGSAFHHTVGVPPLLARDSTSVLECAPPSLLKLHARASWLGAAMVTLRMYPDGAGTRVVMIEDPGSTLTRIIWNPLLHAAVRMRNARGLKRLKALAEAQARASAGDAGGGTRTPTALATGT